MSAAKKPIYEIVPPNELFAGNSYASWVSLYYNWYVSANADKHNDGPVVFLKPTPDPNFIIKRTKLNGVTPGRIYENFPNVRVGGDRLQIYKDQALFLPIITAHWIATEPNADLGYMQDYTEPAITRGGIPDIKNITINEEHIDLMKNSTEQQLSMGDFRISTPVFTLVVPEAEYGTSLKDFMEFELPSGQFPAIVSGYFILLKGLEPGKRYRIHSRASAGRDQYGSYIAEFLYEVEVFNDERSKDTNRVIQTAVFKSMIAEILDDKKKKSELTPESHKGLLGTVR